MTNTTTTTYRPTAIDLDDPLIDEDELCEDCGDAVDYCFCLEDWDEDIYVI